MIAIRIILQITILSVFSILGTVLHSLLHIPLPGSIIGLILLLFCLSYKIVPVSIISDGAGFLLAIFPLLFIPAMVGVMDYPSFFSIHGAILTIVVVLSNIITIISAGIVSQFMENKINKGKKRESCTK
ncbi:CidA/LrgA family protein [Terribacillus sp. FSL K6-0262]|uniref:CidA/LrgA family protein n=1 Tax=Terribacillus sp. FSL K6-0262 TaxID=2921447 RepID=UPI0030EC1441